MSTDSLLLARPNLPKRIALNASVWVAAILFAFPLFYAITVSLKTQGEVLGSDLLPSEPQWGNFAAVFQSVPFWQYIVNSFLVAIAGTAVAVTVSVLAGYAFGRLRWKGRDLAFVVFLGTLMVPQEVIVVPMFILMQWFGWVNTYESLIFPFAFTAFGTFLMRQFFRGIPFELEEAARVDGAGPLRTLVGILIPLAKPAIAVLAVFTFMSFWNSYLWPLIIVSDYADMGTIPIGLASFTSQSGTQWNLQMAATLISMIPTVILVIILQKHLVRGIAMAGLAGR
ncbi:MULTISPECIES: carbohydrate ABC transporter permease [Microbacterium]|uniref:Carbohydrate ABC transporter permease n=1 Tax=Microbacterium wangchenii TaxID=2541726 RepID=A0ABX5SVF8_9MICO|nr:MULTISPECIES: carbohydrate ABC transporter permease [Microbacterium]MCK6065861.1 carbohydrate ABC transporter permease [Microbacterium sp. EYE_512]QBR90165.1 carbohydrate ABC transporter permease [Microbacterium wangchenii]TFV85024.1 carbohydrate ABC transporter permease [Microbacterium sp. dk485]TXK11819.1 carbohydrate ABC transporter permease [Microbacterium wangchenii]